MSRLNPDPPVYFGAFVTVTVLASWTIAFVTITDTVPAYTTPLMMVVPAAVTLSLRRIQGDSIVRTVWTSVSGTTGPALLFAVIYPVLFIGVAALSGLFAPMDINVTLYHVAEENETDADVETLLDAIDLVTTNRSIDEYIN